MNEFGNIHEGIRVTDLVVPRFLSGSNVEIVREVRNLHPPQFAVFDFDGTLSLIRAGWQDVMVPMMVDVLAETGTRESHEELARVALDFVMELNGKQTIYQMIRLAEEVTNRGGRPEEPLFYKHRYHDLLMQRIGSRREALAAGELTPEEMMVPGSFAALKMLCERGVHLFLASGTDEKFVREEAELLKLNRYFGEHIYGAVDNYKSFSKQMVIEKILRDNDIDGTRLLGFGDGYVEIDNIKSVGGTAVAVASDEANRSGNPDAWKRERLLGVGADVVIPDFSDFGPLCCYLWGEGKKV